MRFALILALTLTTIPADAQLFRGLFGSSRNCATCNKAPAFRDLYPGATAVYNNKVWTPETGICCNRTSCQMRQEIIRQWSRQTVSTTPVRERLIPTPQKDVAEMLDILGVQPGKVLYDLGCGDGRILIEAAKRGCYAVGIEINEATARSARERVVESGLGGRITVITGDARNFDLSDADYITMFMYPEVMEELPLDTALPGTKIVSYNNAIPSLPCNLYEYGDRGYYLHSVPVVLTAGPPQFGPPVFGEIAGREELPPDSSMRFYSRENCPPCAEMERSVLPRLKDQGVTIVSTKRHDYQATPCYWIYVGDKHKFLEGRRSYKELVKEFWKLAPRLTNIPSFTMK